MVVMEQIIMAYSQPHLYNYLCATLALWVLATMEVKQVKAIHLCTYGNCLEAEVLKSELHLAELQT